MPRKIQEKKQKESRLVKRSLWLVIKFIIAVVVQIFSQPILAETSEKAPPSMLVSLVYAESAKSCASSGLPGQCAEGAPRPELEFT